MNIFSVIIFVFFGSDVIFCQVDDMVEYCYDCPEAVQMGTTAGCTMNRCECNNSPRLRFKVSANATYVDPTNETDSSTNRNIANSNSSNDQQIHSSNYLLKPRVHCREVDFLVIAWDNSVYRNTFYYVRYWPHVRHGPDMPPIHSTETPLTTCDYAVLAGLDPNTSYRIELRSFSIDLDEEQARHRRSPPIFVRTRKTEDVPLRIHNFWLSSWTLNARKYTANVRWNKAPDLTCYYKITYFSNDFEDYKTLDVPPLVNNNFNITDLEFGTFYALTINPYRSPQSFPLLAGPETWLNVTTPTCLQTFNQIDDCVPDKPEGLEVTERPLRGPNRNRFNVTVEWKKPKFDPYYYSVNLWLIDSNNTMYSNNVTGNETSVVFLGVPLTTQYDALLVAHSAKGPSVPAVIHRNLISGFVNTESSDTTSLSPKHIWFIVFPLILVCLIIIFTFKYHLSRKNRKREKYLKENFERRSLQSTISTITISGMKQDDWEIDINKLVLKEIIGGGAFGIVRKGSYNSGKQEVEVAIKMLKENPVFEEIKEFQQEIQIMKDVPKHPHLVSMIGCVTKDQLLLVAEYCSKGDLQTYLRTASDKILKANLIQGDDYVEKSVFNKLYDFDQLELDDIPQNKDLLSIARQVALGMEYLASFKLIHRDLAARNILLTENNMAKISDFGLSRDVYYDNVYCKSTSGKLPIRWMALECMTHQVYTTQSDVWSFGVLLWEIITLGGTPYPGIATSNIMVMLKSGYRMLKPNNCSDELYSLMFKCWHDTPNSRPTFRELRQSLDELLSSFADYLIVDEKGALNDTEFIVKDKTSDFEDKQYINR